MAKRKNLKAYVRLDSSRKPIPGSLIYRQDKPYGRFAPMVDPSGDICCPSPSGPIPPTPRCQGGATYTYYSLNAAANSLASYAGIDSQCNTYYLFSDYVADGECPAETTCIQVVYKVDATGTLVWSKRLSIEDTSSGTNGYEYYCMLISDVNNAVYLMNESSMLAFDKTTGATKWGKEINYDLINFGTYGFSNFCMSPDESSLYAHMAVYDYGSFTYNVQLLKVDAATGALTKETKVNYAPITPGVNISAYGINCDSDGNVVFGGAIVGGLSYFTKVDGSLTTKLWDATTNSNANVGFFNLDTPSIDYKGDIYAGCYTSNPGYNGPLIQKYDGQTGEMLWVGYLNGQTFNGYWDYRFDENGDVWFATQQSVGSIIPGEYSIVNSKMTPDGDLIYQYSIVDSANNIGLNTYWFNTGLLGPDIWKGNYVVPYLIFNAGYKPIAVNLPPTLVTGTYGPFTFTSNPSASIVKIPFTQLPANVTVLSNSSLFAPHWQNIGFTTYDSSIATLTYLAIP